MSVASNQAESYVRPVAWGVTKSAALTSGERRLEATTYLSDGYGLRMAITARETGWTPLAKLASVWQPSRLKGITVSPGYGTPFLAAGQTFETRPASRKWLALEKTDHASARFVEKGWLLVSCSGNVGRVTMAYEPHLDHLISHDLLRVQATDPAVRGWLYAYMRTPTFRAISTGTHYGHVVKHLEPSHVRAMPVVLPSPDSYGRYEDALRRIFELRARALAYVLDVERVYADAIGQPAVGEGVSTVTVSSRELVTNRRRFDGYHYNREARSVINHFRAAGLPLETLGSLCEEIWWPNRFSRVFGDNGTPYFSAEELFNLNSPVSKRVYAGLIRNAEDYYLRAGWLLMARSGQIYGLNGSVMLATRRHEEYLVSEDLIRLKADRSKVAPGYLLMALNHPTLGRPLVIRNAYGTSIPHLEPGDVSEILIPRLGEKVEGEIATAMEQAAVWRSQADALEDEITDEAEDVIWHFLHGEATGRTPSG